MHAAFGVCVGRGLTEGVWARRSLPFLRPKRGNGKPCRGRKACAFALKRRLPCSVRCEGDAFFLIMETNRSAEGGLLQQSVRRKWEAKRAAKNQTEKRIKSSACRVTCPSAGGGARRTAQAIFRYVVRRLPKKGPDRVNTGRRLSGGAQLIFAKGKANFPLRPFPCGKRRKRAGRAARAHRSRRFLGALFLQRAQIAFLLRRKAAAFRGLLNGLVVNPAAEAVLFEVG